MNRSRPWSFQPFRQTLQHGFWKKEIVSNEIIVSKSIDAKLGLKSNEAIPFSKVEILIDEFVEEFVPNVIDCLHKCCINITALHQGVSEDECYEVSLKILQELKEKLHELNKLRALLIETDKDDFDLRICPAKAKLNSAIEHFLESSCSSSGDTYPQWSQSSKHRSCKAKDLLSYLPEEEDEQKVFEDFTDLPDTTTQDLHKNEINDAVTEESVENLNKDVSDLHRIMLELHSIVSEQGEVSDSIVDHVVNASEHVERGNKHLKKATVAKRCLQAALFPVVGAVVGAVVGGPIGLMAGMKIGSVAGGFAMAGVTGTVVGYQGGKMLKKKSLQQTQSQDNNS